MKQSFFGKYRGKVEKNKDPQEIGRLQVSVPAVFGEGTQSWAMPCVPYAGNQLGIFAIPPEGANVWVEFEGGDTDYPIWSGCFWGQGEAPASPAVADMKVLKTDGVTLTIHDKGDGLTLEVNPPSVTGPPLKMVFNSSGIELQTGAASVKLTATGVSINDGALEVI